MGRQVRDLITESSVDIVSEATGPHIVISYVPDIIHPEIEDPYEVTVSTESDDNIYGFFELEEAVQFAIETAKTQDLEILEMIEADPGT